MMERIQKGTTYEDLGFRVDNKGVAYDLATGRSLAKSEVDQRLLGSDLTNIAKQRGGAAGVWDRNKREIKIAAKVLPALIATVATGGTAAPATLPLMLAALGASTGATIEGLDRPGKSGIGFDAKQALRGAGEGAAGAMTGYTAGKTINAVTGRPNLPGLPTGVRTVDEAGKVVGGPGGPGTPQAPQGGKLPSLEALLGSKQPGETGGGFDFSGLVSKYGIPALSALQLANAAALQKKANEYAQSAQKQSEEFWNQRAGLRSQGISGMQAQAGGTPMPNLAKIGAIGNPFASTGV